MYLGKYKKVKMGNYNKNKREEFGSGLYVEVRNNNVEQAIRRLKKLVTKSGLMNEIRERRYFVSNTEKRLKAKAAGKARHRRRIAKENNEEKKRLY